MMAEESIDGAGGGGGGGGGELVLVSGGSGFVASHVIEVFRAARYRVRTTVRGGKSEAAEYFRQRGVEVVEADLNKSEGWPEAVAGCVLVLHVASPFFLSVKDGVKDLIEPAVAGTRHVLEACRGSKVLRRVVLTSSVAAIGDSHNGPPGGFTEEHWNESATAKDSPYPRSKVEGERFAWGFVGLHKADLAWDLVTVNPVGVFGPVLLPPKSEAQVNTSNQLLVKILNKAFPGYPNFIVNAVDVRDCAQAHYLAAVTPAARGRYICSGGTASMAEVAGMLLQHVPELAGLIHPPTRSLPNFVSIAAALFDPTISFKAAWNSIGAPPLSYSNAKSIAELHMTYRPLHEQFVDAAKSLAAAGNGILTDRAVVAALTVKAP